MIQTGSLNHLDKASSTRPPWVSVVIFTIWLTLVLVLVHSHVVWRDEVRALSFALYGSNIVEMLRGLRGDSNPALWHLLLRASYVIFNDVRVLQVLSVLVVAGAAALLVFKSPFSRLIVSLILLSEFMLYEYPVVARNYGLSLLLMFMIAAAYPRNRNNSIIIGLLLFLLANTNVHCVLLGGAFLVFWGLEVVFQNGFRWNSAARTLVINTGLYAAGVLVCALTVYPTFNDAAIGGLRPGQNAIAEIAQALFQPASRFKLLVLDRTWLPLHPDIRFSGSSIARWVMSLVMLGSTLSLMRRPAALAAALIGLFSFSFLFTVVYPGFYRHQALWLVFLIALNWIVLAEEKNGGPGEVEPSLAIRRITGIGYGMFVLLIALQVPSGITAVADTAVDPRPTSRIKDLATLISSKPELHNATILADPDYMVEPVPYYLSNPTYLVREHRFGRVVRFSTQSQLSLTLDDLLNAGRCIVGSSRQPVVFLIKVPLDLAQQSSTVKESYDWTFHTSPSMVRRFLTSTRKLAHFDPVKRTDIGEYYDVYQLSPPQPQCVVLQTTRQVP